MAPVSAMLHNLGVRILRYLDDWLILASSRMKALWARDMVLDLCRQFRQVTLLSISVCDLSGDGHLEPDFEGFPISREGFESLISDRRIFVLQEAGLSYLEEPVRLPVFLLSSSPGRSPQDEAPPVGFLGLVGFSGRVCLGGLDSLYRAGSSVVV